MFKRNLQKFSGLSFRTNQQKSNCDANTSYTQLNQTNDNNSDDNRYHKQRSIPWKAIIMAVFLSIGGLFTMTMCCLIFSGHVNIKPNDGIAILLLLGVIMFIPGFYHCRIAYYAYYRCPGFSFDDIPDFD